MKMTLFRVDLPLRHTVGVARESTCVVRSLIVRLEQDGLYGYGEAAESQYYNVPVEESQELLAEIREEIEEYTLADPVAFWGAMAPHLESNRFAQCALDVAACDLWGKMREKPLYKLWGYGKKVPPESSYTVSVDTPDFMIAKMKDQAGWPSYKIKVGGEDAVNVVRELRQHTNAAFRVDATGTWTPDQTVKHSEELKALNVEFIEQPLPPGDWEGMRYVHARSALPIMADESCATEADLDQCASVFDGVNVKLVKCGGLTPARRMLRRAAKWGLKTMAGCMVESTVASSAMAQLAPIADYLDLDGTLFVDKTVADGILLERGRIIYPAENGTGVTLRKRVAV